MNRLYIYKYLRDLFLCFRICHRCRLPIKSIHYRGYTVWYQSNADICHKLPSVERALFRQQQNGPMVTNSFCSNGHWLILFQWSLTDWLTHSVPMVTDSFCSNGHWLTHSVPMVTDSLILFQWSLTHSVPMVTQWLILFQWSLTHSFCSNGHWLTHSVPMVTDLFCSNGHWLILFQWSLTHFVPMVTNPFCSNII